MLDEPVNGLDPEGIQWVRSLLKSLAAEGRAVFVSSHLMSEMAKTADHLVVIGRGHLIADTTVDEFVQRASKQSVRVRSPDAGALADVFDKDVTIDRPEPGVLVIHGAASERVGELAAEHGIVLHELTPQRASLEEAFMELTRDSIEFRAEAPSGSPEPEAVSA